MKNDITHITVGLGKACLFTICNSTYLPQALVSIKSFSNFHNNTKTAILLVDADDRSIIEGIPIFTIKDIIDYSKKNNINLDFEILKNYNVTSLCTAVKPLALIFFKNEFLESDYYIYTDPDTMWMQNPLLKLESKSLYFFRHRDFLCTTTGYSGLNFLTFGGINLGLMIDTGKDIETVIDWNKFAFPINLESSMLGYYTDQRPADLMVLSNRAKSIYNESINCSYWNIADINLRYENDTFQVKQFDKWENMVMFHFSGYKAALEDYGFDRKNEYIKHPNSDLIRLLHLKYAQLINAEIHKVTNIKLDKNSYGTSNAGSVYGFLINENINKYSLIKKIMLRIGIKFNLFLLLIDRIYKIKNPLGL